MNPHSGPIARKSFQTPKPSGFSCSVQLEQHLEHADSSDSAQNDKHDPGNALVALSQISVPKASEDDAAEQAIQKGNGARACNLRGFGEVALICNDAIDDTGQCNDKLHDKRQSGRTSRRDNQIGIDGHIGIGSDAINSDTENDTQNGHTDTGAPIREKGIGMHDYLLLKMKSFV